MKKMNLWSHDQAPMAHQSKTGKRHPNGNITRKMRLGRTTGVTASRVPTPTKMQNYEATVEMPVPLVVSISLNTL